MIVNKHIFRNYKTRPTTFMKTHYFYFELEMPKLQLNSDNEICLEF
jgi:hypothetical protein